MRPKLPSDACFRATLAYFATLGELHTQLKILYSPTPSTWTCQIKCSKKKQELSYFPFA
ncbi:hypothetical protein Plhal304r1_c011g0044081 [Plasmopara halstedii]